MKSPAIHGSGCVFCVLTLFAFTCLGAERPGRLHVGAARVDITPAPDAGLAMYGYADRKTGFQRIHDRIHVRAIVLSDSRNQAVLVAFELGSVPNQFWDELSKRIAKELSIPAENVIVAAVHDHSAPTLVSERRGDAGGSSADRTAAYAAKVQNDALEAVRRARANLQPAQFGLGTRTAYININRREFYPDQARWGLGQNPGGPSDKTVAVLKFTDLAGKPIALLINYPVHCTVMGPENLSITGEIAGATSRYVEQYYQGRIPIEVDMGWEERLRKEEVVSGDGPVAVWTSGAAGDQNPVSMVRGEDFTMVNGLGRLLGEQAVRAANSIDVMSSQATLAASQRVLTCAGRRWDAAARAHGEYKFVDSDAVNIRLSLLKLNNVYLAGVSGEVFAEIGQRLKRDLPGAIVITHANGSSGYIPSDDAYDQISYEIGVTRLRPGCAEQGIVKTFLDMSGVQ